ncbi:BTAD domain-containing putative transcriptional regulator [uncultured Ruegeria sp.]|uniref:BTAD domain-containing putative transcriptional regulator n=1 Tax=uncultured Ruegeria sp. TaxID=259304 RepID=UPI00261EE0AB|nr:BTAD domain-containing putative transcriptional regulator [uncultured Ruegeria sp.]
MAKPVKVKLLGDFEVVGSTRCHFPTRKTGLLFAYLAMQGGAAVSRDKLKLLFWSDRSEQQAAGSLRRSLSDIRSIVGEAEGAPILVTSKTDVALVAEQADVDAFTFERLATSPEEEALKDAANLYIGDFLATVVPPDSGTDAWIKLETQRLKNIVTGLVERLAEVSETQEGLDAAEALALRLLHADSICEEAHRALIVCFLKSGRENAAKRQYEDCTAELLKHLGAEPEEKTRRLLNKSNQAQPKERTKEELSTAAGEEAIATASEVRRLSIAVLPIHYIGPDADQQFFADGITDELLMELSRIRELVVISRQSSGTLKNLQPAEVRESLGVDYLVSGSLRRSGAAIRVTAQLIDTETGAQIWARRFERTFDDFFALQDEITQSVVESIYPEITGNELEAALRKPDNTLTAWEMFHRGMWHIHQGSADDLEMASSYFERAARESPRYASAYSGQACVALIRATTHDAANCRDLTKLALELGETALSVDRTDSYSLTIHASALTIGGRLQDAHAYVEEALQHNPNLVMALYCRAQILMRGGSYSDALGSVESAIVRSPRDPQMASFLTLKACCEYGLENYTAMYETSKAAARIRASDNWSQLLAAVAADHAGHLDEASAICETLRERCPEALASSASFLTENTTAEFGQKLKSDFERLGLS